MSDDPFERYAAKMDEKCPDFGDAVVELIDALERYMLAEVMVDEEMALMDWEALEEVMRLRREHMARVIAVRETLKGYQLCPRLNGIIPMPPLNLGGE